MGLFDSYYDPGTYQNGGGLIDRLLSQLGAQGQYQPGPGSGFPGMLPSDQAQYGAPQQPMQANALMQPQMQPQQPMQPQYALPQNAQPTQGQLPVQQGGMPPPQPQMQPQPQAQQGIPNAYLQPGGGGVGGFFRGLGENAHNGLINGIMGGIAGANGQGSGDIHNAQLQAQYKALLDAGIPQQKALLAVINPEAGKLILADALGKEKFSVVQTGENGLGRKQYEVFNANTGTHTPINSAGSADDSGGGLGNMDLSGKAYLASIPAAQRGIVQGMVEGTIAPPSSFALAKPYWVNMVAAAKNYDPSFDATNWSGRLAGVKDFSAGKSSEMVRSANQTLHHVGQLLTSMDDLNNGSYPLVNRIGNAASEATGSGTQGAFRTNAHAVAEELSKVFKGSNLSDAEIKAWESNLNENMSPEQQRAQVGKLRDLLQGSLDALEEKRLNSIGPIAAEKQGPLIKPEGQKVLDRIQKWIANGTGAAQGATPAQTKTGVSWSVVQ